jgi:hypothetical protein|tara:strand:- start:574 stop:780 length:207 start_codon:yes stop_codon:yes gene_type:complete
MSKATIARISLVVAVFGPAVVLTLMPLAGVWPLYAMLVFLSMGTVCWAINTLESDAMEKVVANEIIIK